VKVGDLVKMNEVPRENEEHDIGIVIKVNRNVEIPPLIEVMWAEGMISRTYQDELEVIREN